MSTSTSTPSSSSTPSNMTTNPSTTSTPPTSTTTPAPDTRTRILALHGGGVNAAIFSAQSRSLLRHLTPTFRVVFADGPFLCDPHSDVTAVYGSYTPFRRWLRWLPEHPELEAETAIEEIAYAIRSAMEEDDRQGGQGEWVGLMGFSQGAKLAASLMIEQQVREDRTGIKRDAKEDEEDAEWEERYGGSISIGESRAQAQAQAPEPSKNSGVSCLPDVNWRFGILLAGRAPLSNLNPSIMHSKALVSAGDISEGFQFVSSVDKEVVLRKPTVHVHGMADAGLHLHRRLLDEYCEKGTTRLVEWEGAHRIPIKGSDVEPVVRAIWDVAEEVEVKVNRTF